MVAVVLSLGAAVAGMRGNTAALSDVAASAASPSPEAVPSPSPAPALAPSPSPSPTPPADPHAALRARLLAVLADPGLALPDGTVSVAIRDAAGRTVLDVEADRPLLPASTQKLVTAAAALQALGPDHRFVTQAVATGPVGDDGTLDGDLVLVGSGDPVLGTAGYGRYVYPVRPRTPLEELAVRIRTRGILRVAGHVVADSGRFAGVTTAPGWKQRYFWDFDARHITGLTVDGGLVVALLLPDEEGTAKSEGMAAPDATATEAPDPGVLLEAVPDDVHPDVVLRLSEDPERDAARQFQRLLEARSIAVRPEVAVDPAPASGTVIAAVESDPLRDILRHTVQRSDNHAADTLFRELGVRVMGDGTWEGGAQGVRQALGGLGLPWSGVVLADGSGLSRSDRLTAAFLAELDVAMAASSMGDVWTSLMAISGREGTLRHRLRGTAGEGRFFGKTGTLDDVAAVAGHVTGPAGAVFHLAVVGNDVHGGEREVVRRIVDQLTLALVAEVDGAPWPERIATEEDAP